VALDPFDDYPIHQTPDPIAQAVTGDRNCYDRYFFNGYTEDGSLYIGCAMGLYANRSVMDAAFSVVRDGVQTSIHASRRAPTRRDELTVSPISITVEEPLQRLRVSVADSDSGVVADLVFTARTDACEEPRFTMLGPGNRRIFDYTRLTQFGTWEGTLAVDGVDVPIHGMLGSRDRSWGVRPVGERDQGAPGDLPQFFWLWAPINFSDVCTHFDVQELPDGSRWHDNGVVLPVGGGTSQHMETVNWDIQWRPGTRRADAATITLTPRRGDALAVELAPMLDFQMLGIGYLHPTWGHGVWKGEHAVEVERWRLADLDPMAPTHLHVQQVCRATVGDRVGTGVLEILAIGPHEQAGFRELLDPAPAR
jgi:hypothetical protein